MGYETRLYIVKPSNIASDFITVGNDWYELFKNSFYYDKTDNKITLKSKRALELKVNAYYCSVISMIDLCKCCDIFHENLFNKNLESRYYLYASDGDTPKLEDAYGDMLKAYKMGDVLNALKLANSAGEYRRYKTAIALIESMLDDYGDLLVITEGH